MKAYLPSMSTKKLYECCVLFVPCLNVFILQINNKRYVVTKTYCIYANLRVITY